MSEDDKKKEEVKTEEVKKISIELTVNEINVLLEKYNICIKAPGTNVDTLYQEKSYFAKIFQEAANKK